MFAMRMFFALAACQSFSTGFASPLVGDKTVGTKNYRPAARSTKTYSGVSIYPYSQPDCKGDTEKHANIDCHDVNCVDINQYMSLFAFFPVANDSTSPFLEYFPQPNCQGTWPGSALSVVPANGVCTEIPDGAVSIKVTRSC